VTWHRTDGGGGGKEDAFPLVLGKSLDRATYRADGLLRGNRDSWDTSQVNAPLVLDLPNFKYVFSGLMKSVGHGGRRRRRKVAWV
jgi:hypothetical protein